MTFRITCSQNTQKILLVAVSFAILQAVKFQTEQECAPSKRFRRKVPGEHSC